LKLLTDKYLEQYKRKVGKLDSALEMLKTKTKEASFEFKIESSAVFSSNIEGNPIDLNLWMNSKLLKEKARPKEHQEIQDLIDAYDFARGNALTETSMLRTHEMLTQQFLPKSSRGKYRTGRVGIYSSRGLVYLAIEEQFVQREMTLLFEDIAELMSHAKMSTEETFYNASAIHLRFAQIHPFADGNGRVARLLEKWFLASRLGEIVWKMSSEEYYWNNRPTYYQNINLGVNYCELDYDRCLPFLLMLTKAVSETDEKRNHG
jgi:Fic family protein